MSVLPAIKYISVEEYLEREDASQEKHEYYNGEVFTMAGGSINHNRIVRNALIDIGQFLKNKSCEVFPSDLKIYVRSEESYFIYPDLSVVCNGPQFYKDRKDIVTNPVIIIEVLSPDTMNYDRSEKFELYRSIASLKEYILISSTKILLEKFVKKAANEWLLTEYKSADDFIVINAIGFETTLSEFYSDVVFETK